MSLHESKIRFLKAMLGLLWKHWSALGVSTYVEKTTESILDIEALIVVSSWASRFDERLYDLVLDWLLVRGDCVNIQRLKAIAKASQFTDSRSLRYMADIAMRNGGRKWASLADVPEVRDPLAPLFISEDGSEVSFCPQRDETALRHGFVRNLYKPRNLIVEPNPREPATVLLRLRGLCGISARADVLAALLDGVGKSASELVTFCGYTWKSVNEALRELRSTGLLMEIRTSPRNCVYRLKNLEAFSSIISFTRCKPVNWIVLYETLGTIWQTISDPKLNLVSTDTIRAELVRTIRQVNQMLVSVDQPSLDALEQLFSLPDTLP